MREAELRYHEVGAAMDAHVDSCPQCLAGRECLDGDLACEAEIHAMRAWEREDPAAVRQFVRRDAYLRGGGR